MTKIINIKEYGVCLLIFLIDDLICQYAYGDFEMVTSLLDIRELKNNFSEPVDVLPYKVEDNVLTFAKFNIETMDITIGNTVEKIRLKDKNAFYDYVEDKFVPSSIKDNPAEKLLYKTIDRDGKTFFAYYKNNTIDAFRSIDNKPFYIKIEGPEDLLNNYQEFREFIEENKANIDNKFKKEVERYQRLQIEKANREFDKHVSEVRMNGKPKRTDRGI